MTHLDRASLDRLLPATPGSPDWDDVLSRTGAQQRRHRLVVVLAAVAILAVGTASAFAMRAFLVDRGFIGLPPLGATPSTPASGELAISYWVGSPPGANPGRSQAWVYTDGRLIWLRETDPDRARLQGAANRWSTGFLEQRLTRKGVELLRSEIVSSGVFGHDKPPPGSERIPFYTEIAVRMGGRLVPVRWVSDLRSLETRLWDPASWLPASAWTQRRTRAYVPSRYQVCYGGLPTPLEPSRILPLLPPAAADLLRAKGRTRREGRRGWAGGPFVKSYDYCSAVTTREAREIANALARAGAKQRDPVQLNFRVDVPGPKVVDPIRPDDGPVRNTVFITFEPLLPHGEATCSPCG
ncbi:MAG: hypothetical protein A2Y55_04915 [Actinobacteria bacterium RBG_16_68_12]|nr:MAG: hypothetical protein A2Y55_04915 [Actinobacteria bacterium RBG_16_68_12]